MSCYFPQIRWVLTIATWLSFFPLIAQHPAWHQYTTKDGLPDNEVNQIIQDSRGYLWITTQQGICRYNGYDFIRPIDTTAMRGGETFYVTEDNRGRIWFGHLDVTLRIVENDTVHSWKYNDVLECYRDSFAFMEQLGVKNDGTVWLGLLGLGLLSVDTLGNSFVTPNSKGFLLEYAKIGDKVVFSSKDVLNDKAPWEPIWISIGERHDQEIRNKITLPYKYQVRNDRGVWPLRNGKNIHYYGKNFYLIRGNTILWHSVQNLTPAKIVEIHDGSILVAAHQGEKKGMFYYPSLTHFKNGQGINLLPGYFVTDILCDNEGGWWAATQGDGIFYCKNPTIEVYNTEVGLPSNQVMRLAKDGTNRVYAGFRPSAVGFIDLTTKKYHPLPRPPVFANDIWSLYYDTSSQKLWCGDFLCYWEKGTWTSIPYLRGKKTVPKGLLAKKIIPDPIGPYLWTSASFGFFRVDLRNNTGSHWGQKGNFWPRTFAVLPDNQGNIWVTTAHGLRLWVNGRYELPPFHHPALNDQPRDMEPLPQGGMVLTIPGKGLLISNAKGAFTQITTWEGLASNFITKLYIGSQGTIYGCSNAGLNILRFQSDSTWQVETVSTRQGLPSNQVNDVTEIDHEIWIATDKGLVRYRPVSAPIGMPRPVFEQLVVNGKSQPISVSMKFPYYKNNFSIGFFALHFRSEGNIRYRYRLLGSNSNYTYSNSRLVNYANLGAGAYTFEVQAQNEDQQWSEPARWSFAIHPAWWRTWWFRSTAMLALIGAVWAWYRNRLRDLRHENALSNKIRDLESAALRAQMNPHFIFNCLSSIQHFIVENDVDAATRYLARFARLVRLALHGSVDGCHTLGEEIEMLENYLALEQLRFEGKFTYEIQVDENLDPDEITIPPMLVQPFIENALVHGLKSKTGKGIIHIGFTKSNNALMVTITDNGPGLSPTANITESAHKSIGMTLTQRRLEILSGKQGKESFAIENITGPDGIIAGCRVVLGIPMT